MKETPNDLIVAEYALGLTLKEIAALHGVSCQTVTRRLKTAGIPIRPYTGRRPGRQRQYDVPLDRVAELAGSCSVAEIAGDLGVPEEVIRQRMVEAEIPRLLAKARTDRNYFYRDGRTWDSGGYVLVLVPDHPAARPSRRYTAEHRLVAEAELGRFLLPGEVVDHLDSDTTNNRPANLRVFPSNADHLRATLTGRPKRSRSRSSFLPAGPTPSASETGAEPSLRRHPLFPFPLGTAGLALLAS